METITFDFTPDPRVLIALTQTPLKPLDALCELIDNSIDSFTNSKLAGKVIEHPKIWITLPKKSELDSNVGIIRIRDNGPGMSTEQAEKAIKAGYSGNNSIDTLGLFGMGFNISTGKLGVVTQFMTARSEDDFCTKTKIDLEEINEKRDYHIIAEKIEKPLNFQSGTQIEISRWWPDGHPNHGFVYKLIGYTVKRIREELGRRYATILRENDIQIIVNNDPCIPFEHCVWDSKRYVSHQKYKKIPARYDFNEVLTTKRRCARCRSIISDKDYFCPSCGCTEIRTLEERIWGWVGIQRFDSTTQYGIDLIRNGRAIKIFEKNAFFEFVDDFQNTVKDYPIDSPYGRIVGEVHLDFVPVDFLKQDFQRSSEEWLNAISFLRGNSSLQPMKEGASTNDSYIYKLFQGYRKVRTAGTTDMYMGYWDKAAGGPKRISREVEQEYYEKFLAKEPGYYDDAEWWKLVESASIPPASPMITCEECGSDNLAEAEVCSTCGHVLIGKNCINKECGKEIPKSAVTCPYCGVSQIPKVEMPWTCEICGTKNIAGATTCKHCYCEKGSPNPLEEDELLKHSVKDDELSIEDLSIKLSDGNSSNPFNLNTYYTDNSIISPITKERLPIIIFKEVNRVNIYIDKTHPYYLLRGMSPVVAVSTEAATYIFDMHRNLISSHKGHSVSNMVWQLMKKYWCSMMEISEENITKRCECLMSAIKEQITTVIDDSLSERFVGEMNDEQQKFFANELRKYNIPIAAIGELKKNGRFVSYVPNDFLLHILEEEPKLFFNGNIWKVGYGMNIEGFSYSILTEEDNNTLLNYKNALELVVFYTEHKSNNPIELKRVDAALNFLQDKINEVMV